MAAPDASTDASVAPPPHIVGADYPAPQPGSFVTPLQVDAGLVYLKNCGSDQILQQNDAGTAWSCVAGPAAPLTTPISIANGGTGAAMSCSSANLVQATSGTALTCHAMSGDCTISSSGVVTCTQAQGGEVLFGATTGTITAASGATAAGLSQSSTASATPTSMVDVPQVSTAASNQVGSSRGVQLSIPTGTALDGSFYVLRGATNKIFSVGGDQVSGSGGNYSNLCLFPAGGSTAACTDTNVTVQTTTGLVFINTPTGAVGLGVAGSYMLRASNVSTDVAVASGYNLNVNSLTGDYGGCVGCMGMHAVNTAPSTTLTAGDGEVWQDTVGMHATETNGTSITDFVIAPALQGTTNTGQQLKRRLYMGQAQTVNGSTIVTAIVVPLATASTNADIFFRAVGHLHGGVTSYAQGYECLYENNAGTLQAAVTTGISLYKSYDTTYSSAQVGCTISGTNIDLTVVGIAAVSIDWTFVADVIVN
jgi:hypothetical protein